MITLTREGPISTLTLCDGENRFTLEFIERFNALLDEVLTTAGDGPGALVVVGQDKYWSNGINLEALSGESQERLTRFLPELNALLGRLVSFPMPTLAALNGHTFAGGALLALCFDYRLMRTGRGWICLPEVDIEIPFHPAMMTLLKTKLPPAVLRDAVLSGRRYTGDEALTAGLVDATCEVEKLGSEAAAMLTPLAEKKRGIFAAMKTGLYGALAQELGYTPNA